MSKSKSNEIVKTDNNYKNLLDDIRSLVSKGHFKAYKAVDNIKVQTYWQIGERIVREEIKHKDRADYGKYLVRNLAGDLGIQRQRLHEIVKFYRFYENVHSVSGQLSWTHYRALLEVEYEKERLFYQNKAIINSWSVRELKKQIKARLFKSTPKSEHNSLFQTKLPAIRTHEVFKDTYDFSFTEIKQLGKESELEDKLLGNFVKFLKELGHDFCIITRQQPIKVDNKTHFIDIVLYHRGIPCIVLVDLKIGKLDSRDVGQMNKYISYYRRNKQYEHEKDTIGLIICKEAGKEEVMYALDGLEEKIFVAKYKVKLPSESKIKSIIKKM